MDLYTKLNLYLCATGDGNKRIGPVAISNQKAILIVNNLGEDPGRSLLPIPTVPDYPQGSIQAITVFVPISNSVNPSFKLHIIAAMFLPTITKV